MPRNDSWGRRPHPPWSIARLDQAESGVRKAGSTVAATRRDTHGRHASAAKQSSFREATKKLDCFVASAPRNDGFGRSRAPQHKRRGGLPRRARSGASIGVRRKKFSRNKPARKRKLLSPVCFRLPCPSQRTDDAGYLRHPGHLRPDPSTRL